MLAALKDIFPKRFFTTICCLVCILLSNQTTKAQIEQNKSNQPYNRFQWNKLKWKTFHTKAFHVYFPNGNDSLCSFIVRELPEAMKRIKHNMGTSILREPNIIIYPSTTLQYESNIGLYETEPATLPTFIEKGTRLVLAYNGSYDNLKEQLYEALARSIWEAQQKEGIEEQVKKAIKKEDIPFWFKEGTIKYFGNNWPIQQEDALRRSYHLNKFKNWQESIAYQPRLSGQAFCYFLNDQYYPQAVLQLFNQIKKKKNLNRAIRLICKKPLDTVMEQCHRFYSKRFADTTNNIHQDSIGKSEAKTTKDKQETTTIAIPHKKGIIKNVQTSPDGQLMAYTISRNNKRTTYLYNSQAKETTKLNTYLLPPWINDYSNDTYPLIAWKDNSKDLLLTMPKKGKLTITPYLYGSKAESYQINNADGITKAIHLSDNQYLLAAYRNGQSDVVSYDVQKEEYSTYTNNAYDDANPILTDNGQILFSSKRKEIEFSAEQKRTIGFKDTTKQKQGIYKITLNGKEKIISPIITDSIPYVKWDKPVLLKQNKLLVTTTKYGTERFAIIDKQGSTATNNANIKTLGYYEPLQYHEDNQTVSYYNNLKDTLYITSEPFTQWTERNQTGDTTSPWLTDYQKRAAQRAIEDSLIKASKDTSSSFLEGVLLPKNAKEHTKQREDSIAKSLQCDPKKVKPYILQLHSAYFSAKINNDYLINRYQPYKNYQGQFKSPELGGMIQGGFTDLLENHHINIAFRLPASSEGSDFFIKYENTAKKLDWSIAYFRKVESLNADPKRNWVDESGKPYPNNAKVKTHYGEVSVTHPFTYYLSGTVTEAIRYDRTIFLATDKYTLKFEDMKSVWSISTLAISYNKLKPTLPMLYRGFKAKATIDIFQPLSSGNDGTVTGNMIQLQYHLPIYKYITLVSKVQLGNSGGQSRVLYNLGGMDNNITVHVDSNNHPQQNLPYAFQTLVTPLRGYLQNTIQGNQYVVFNSDLYFPIFQTLIPLETPLSFINNLQLGMFTDIATAKETWNSTNPNNDKWHTSYGLSARTTLAGYPIRVDVAWPGTFNTKPVWYFSLNLH